MIRFLAGWAPTRKSLCLALLGAGSSLVLTALISAAQAQAVPILCSDNGGFGTFNCGIAAAAIGSDSTAVGDSAEAAGANSTALGHLAAAVAGNSTALGRNALASGLDSTAIGENAFTTQNATAVGHNAQAGGGDA